MSDRRPLSKPNTESKKEKKGNRAIRIIRTLVLVMILIGFIGAGIVGGIVLSIIKETPPIDASNIYDLLDESSFILDSEGQVIEKIQTDRFRTFIEYAKMPEHLKSAFIAIEDERFWTHKGIDIKRIFGAAWTNFRKGTKQGASTINQQLAKNLYLTKEQTYTRKIKDAYYGILLDKQLTKEQILEVYLNTIYLGGGAYSVQAASQVYFSKDVEDLTIAESALLAGVTRNPSRYSPIRTLRKEDIREDHYILDDSDPIYTIVFNETSLDRQRLVLSLMRRQGHITEEEYQEALAEDIKANLKPNRLTNENISSYFGDLVQKDVLQALIDHGYDREEATNMLRFGGLRIYSTMDLRIQTILEEEYEKPSNFPGTLVDAEGNLIRDAEGNIQPQSAAVILNYRTGEIKALVGGRMTSGRKIYNRAISPRQPGSAIKPIAVYTPAIDQGYTAATVIDDIPIYLNTEEPDVPWPNNWYSERYRGLMTVREALQWSSNVAAVRVASTLGPNYRSSFEIMFDYMEKMGISTVVRRSDSIIRGGKSYNDENFSTALGGMTRGVTPLELTAAYGVLANQGVYVKPITFTKVVDRHGNLILENKSFKNRVLSPDVSYIMTDVLQSIVTSGTASRARLYPGNAQIPVAGKTGTTSDRKDAWFVGYTPYYAAGVWIGNDMPQALADGSRMATELWKNIMVRVHENYNPKNFDVSDNIVRVPVCTKSGKLPNEYCSYDPRGGNVVRTEVFIRGTEPKETCDVHVLAEIHSPSGKLATELTPPWEIETRVFVKRPVPYHPEDNDGIVPTDYIYELPTDYYDPLVDWNFNFFDNDHNDGHDDEFPEDISEDNPHYHNHN